MSTTPLRFEITEPLIPPVPMRNHRDDESYLLTAVHNIRSIDQLVTVPSSARVLDVGCAAGRLALPLIGHLDPEAGGSYDGLDIVRDRIDWARKNVTSRYPHFRFQWVDVRNDQNPSGTIDGSGLEFPYKDGQFDLILFHSVFPHLVPEKAWRYLAESRRVLAPGGHIYSTWYLWDSDTAASVKRNEVLWSFPVSRRDHRLHDAARPEYAVAFDFAALRTQLAAAGLQIAAERRGEWRAQPNHGQDILILKAARNSRWASTTNTEGRLRR